MQMCKPSTSVRYKRIEGEGVLHVMFMLFPDFRLLVNECYEEGSHLPLVAGNSLSVVLQCMILEGQMRTE